MKKLIYISFLMLIFSSCLTVGKIQRNCDKFAQVCTTEKVTETVYRDTTIFKTDTVKITLPRDTVKLTDTVTVINNMAYLAPVYKRFGLIGVNAGVEANILNVNAWLTDSTILQPVSDTILIEKAIKEKAETRTVTIVKKHVPGFYKFTFWIFIIEMIVLTLFILRPLVVDLIRKK